LQRNYANDPATLLYAIDFYTLKKQYANAFKSVDALQKVTEDPFLNYLKANILLLQNDTEKAKSHLQVCMIQLPKYDKPYFLLNDVLLQRKETAELPNLWNAMLLKLNTNKPALTQKLAAMPEIAALKEFQEWK
jgi:predicted Zn-dependent protease